MEVTKQHINNELNRAQKLLWGGSETENIEAHNIVAKLIKDLEGIKNSQGHVSALTGNN